MHYKCFNTFINSLKNYLDVFWICLQLDFTGSNIPCTIFISKWPHEAVMAIAPCYNWNG